MVFPFSSIKDFSITFSDEDELFRKTVRKFVDEELMPRVVEVEKTGVIFDGIIKKGIEMDFTGIGIPEEYDG